MRHPRRPGTHRDRGSGTAIGMFIIFVVLVLSATLLETGNSMRASSHATDVAQEAARAGADKLDLAALRAGAPPRIDPAAAETAAMAYLRQVGETGSVDATAAAVTVTVTITRSRVLLPLIGIKTITVTSTATATPLLS
jgi:Flp pilus assembly protein TadG